jgi:hypothetical protein
MFVRLIRLVVLCCGSCYSTNCGVEDVQQISSTAPAASPWAWVRLGWVPLLGQEWLQQVCKPYPGDTVSIEGRLNDNRRPGPWAALVTPANYLHIH